MSSIIFLIPYFGKWPEWMQLYVDSIRRNPTIDFLFITDCETVILEGIPNISFRKTSFESYIQRYKNILGNDIRISNPYKICDLRPFFGVVHQKDIEKYDFFGWTDTDIFFGDIRSFYTDEILKKYDAISSHAIRLAGHCALLKNTIHYRTVGYRIYQWKEALINPEFVGIDEHGMTNALCMTFWDKVAEKFGFSKSNFFLNSLRKWKMRKYYFVEQYTTPFTSIPWLDGSMHGEQPDEWYYDNGAVTNNRDGERKFLYLHLMNFKSDKWRLDGTKAPWSGMEKYCHGKISGRAVINNNGIFYQ